ncbi:MAG: TonB-dependent receptor plug domain-containing protein [Desulfuromonadaceae bacterium]|nr:TonB-dependent receptor plug domain-containing protein [Desulfuromonadaceae bacterium]
MPNLSFLHTLRGALFGLWLLVALPGIAFAAEADDEDTLGLFSAWRESASTASRAPKPLSQTAENVTVITSDDIRALNAHTLTDILDSIPGIQVQHNGGPGITAYTFIQSSSFRHVQVYVDGVSITNLADNYSETSLIPARIIERVEIVKGSASAAWGSALAGVINVTTKAPLLDCPLAGTVSASIGKQATTDDALELSSSTGRLGYYLAGGYLGSDGLLPNTQLHSTNSHARLTWDLPDKGQLYATFNRTQTRQGDLFVPSYDLKENQDKSLLLAAVGLRQPLGEQMELEITARHSFLKGNTTWLNISDGLTWQPDLPVGSFTNQVSGASLKLVRRDTGNLLVAGSDYNHLELYNNSADGSTYTPYSRSANRWGVYLNDTVTMGSVSVIPGARYDHTQTAGDLSSYSLGATWQLSDTTLLRAYGARGYGMPQFLDVDKPAEKIWTTQVGVESTAVPYLWLKGTLFRNETWGEDVERHKALGAEVELRTTPVYNTTLGVDYTFVDTIRSSDGTQVNYDPRQTVKVSLRYDDRTYRALLAGSHIYWNSLPEDNARYGLLWDLHLGATILKRENSSLELFFSGHNLFNGSQYLYDIIPNTGRWFEGGMRVNF